jgi:predicted membrane protein (TIGR00267 family)
MIYLRNVVRGLVDGILSTTGVVVGMSIGESQQFIVLASLSAGIANAISNLAGAFTAESADVYHEIDELVRRTGIESKRIKSLRIFKRRISEVYLRGLIDALTTFFGTVIVILPFFFLSAAKAIELSVFLAIFLSFLLGMIIAKLSKESFLEFGLKMCLFSLISIVICYLLAEWI